MAKKKTINRRHVVPRNGKWAVVAGGAARASSAHSTQTEAIARAKEVVANLGGGEVTIHGHDGKIRDSDTVAPGNDPSSIKDRKH